MALQAIGATKWMPKGDFVEQKLVAGQNSKPKSLPASTHPSCRFANTHLQNAEIPFSILPTRVCNYLLSPAPVRWRACLDSLYCGDVVAPL